MRFKAWCERATRDPHAAPGEALRLRLAACSSADFSFDLDGAAEFRVGGDPVVAPHTRVGRVAAAASTPTRRPHGRSTASACASTEA